MKKILILTVTAGNGHNACAKSVKARLEKESDVEVKIVDLLKSFSSPINIWTADKGYSFAVSKALWIYNIIFDILKESKPKNRYKCPAQACAVSTVAGLLQEIVDFQPDVIYCTHFYAGIALTDIRLVYKLPCKIIISSLDYEYSPFWEASIGVDYFTVPNEDFVDECLKLGFKREQILPYGLPVDERASIKIDKLEARKVLDIDEKAFTIMVMFGGGYWSGGYEIFKKLLKALKHKNAQIIMINGKNKRSYNKIEKMDIPSNLKVVNVGFTDKVALYMSASDIIINKAGGPSLTEMINQELPMIITEKIPAQELYNLEYMKSKGTTLSFKNAKELKENVVSLMEDEDKREKMSKNARQLKSNGIEKVVKLIMSMPNADYSELLSEDIDFRKVKHKIKQALNIFNRKELKIAREKEKQEKNGQKIVDLL